MADEFNAFGEPISQGDVVQIEEIEETVTQEADDSTSMTQEVNVDRYEQLAKTRDMAEAYLTITAQMGPSAQLIAFVNFDGKLSEELGVGLESLSVVDQHEALAKSLDLEQMDVAATEALVDNVRNLARGLDAASGTAQKAYLGGGHSTLGLIGNVGKLASQVALSATNHLVAKVEDYDELANIYRDTVDLFKLEEHIGDMMPTGFSQEEWTKFHEHVHPAIKKYNGSWITWGLAVPKSELGTGYTVEWGHAKWTESRYKNFQEKLDKLRTEVNALSKRYAHKMTAVEGFLKSFMNSHKSDHGEMKRVNSTVNKLVISTKSMFSRTHQRIDFMQSALDEVKTNLYR